METMFANSLRTVCKQFSITCLQTVCKLFANCFQTMFPVQTSVVLMPVVSVEVAAAASVYYLALLINSRKGKKKRKTWVRKFLEKGAFYGDLLLKDLRVDGAGFTNFLRMSTTDFEILLRMVAPKITTWCYYPFRCKPRATTDSSHKHTHSSAWYRL